MTNITTVSLPADFAERAKDEAAKRKISVSKLIRISLAKEFSRVDSEEDGKQND